MHRPGDRAARDIFLDELVLDDKADIDNDAETGAVQYTFPDWRAL